MNEETVELKDMSRRDRKPLAHLENADLMPLPAPLQDPAGDVEWKPLSDQAREKYECALDDTCAVNVPRPQSREEEYELVRKFLVGPGEAVPEGKQPVPLTCDSLRLCSEF